ncbi:MAG: DUF937 domain-containing protein [Humibacillus sp.]
MASYDEILGQVPLGQLAEQLGVDQSEVEQATRTALPALLGGLHANASDPAGAQSLASALSAHEGNTVTSLADVDEQDGHQIVGNIFGGNTDAVMSQLGGVGSGGAGGALVQRLLPLLAPIVMAWLAKKVGQGGLGSVLGGSDTGSTPQASTADGGPLFPGGQGAGSTPVQAPGSATTTGQASTGSNPIEDILGSVLGGGSGGPGGPGGVLGGILGGLLGGGKR